MTDDGAAAANRLMKMNPKRRIEGCLSKEGLVLIQPENAAATEQGAAATEQEAEGVEARLASPKNQAAIAHVKSGLSNKLARIDDKLAQVRDPARRKRLEKQRALLQRRLAKKLARAGRLLSQILAAKNRDDVAPRPEEKDPRPRAEAPPSPPAPTWGEALAELLRPVCAAIEAPTSRQIQCRWEAGGALADSLGLGSLCTAIEACQFEGEGDATTTTTTQDEEEADSRTGPVSSIAARASASLSVATDADSNSDSSFSEGTASETSDDDDDAEDAKRDAFFHGPAADLRGQVLGGRYRVVCELGRGTFGRVVECYDVERGDSALERVGLGGWRGTFRPKTSGLYAVKVIRNVAKYVEDATIEADILRQINATGGRGVTLFPVLFETFDLPTGSQCFVLERLGKSLHDTISAGGGEGLPIRHVRAVAVQLFDALDHLHSAGLIHTDLKPENVLFVVGDAGRRNAQIKVIDFGGAVWDKDSKGKTRTSIVNTRQYRAPEILLRSGWDFPSDVWAAGCTVAEAALGRQLFPAESAREHLAMIDRRIVGGFPRRMLQGPVAAKCFDRTTGRHLAARVLTPESVRYLDQECPPLQEEVGEEAVAAGVYDLLGGVLAIDPWLRPRAKQAWRLATSITTCDDVHL